ncbi:hypothetical protein [Spiroplasma endosymbiont of Danaus chrysippus]|nr:hypothetical protein [Spiroplasma endosymbiont of Danaus chrysippus]
MAFIIWPGNQWIWLWVLSLGIFLTPLIHFIIILYQFRKPPLILITVV